jgi:hypothetical protein
MASGDNLPEVGGIDHVKVFFTLLVGSALAAFLVYGWNVTLGPILTNAIKPGSAPTPTGNATVSAAVSAP